MTVDTAPWATVGPVAFQEQKVGLQIGPSPAGVTVVARDPVGPARAAGLQLGDVLCGVNGAPVRDLPHEEVRALVVASARPLRMTFGRPQDVEGCEAAYGPITARGPATKTGWVMKYSTTGSHRQANPLQRFNKKRRWLALTDSDLSYSAAPEAPEPLRVLPLASIVETTSEGSTFSVLSLNKADGDRVEMRCVCESAEEAAAWAAAISGAGSAPSGAALWGHAAAVARRAAEVVVSVADAPRPGQDAAAALGLRLTDDHHVAELAQGGAVLAAGRGVMPGDALLRVQGQAVAGKSVVEVAELLRRAERPLELVFQSARTADDAVREQLRMLSMAPPGGAAAGASS